MGRGGGAGRLPPPPRWPLGWAEEGLQCSPARERRHRGSCKASKGAFRKVWIRHDVIGKNAASKGTAREQRESRDGAGRQRGHSTDCRRERGRGPCRRLGGTRQGCSAPLPQGKASCGVGAAAGDARSQACEFRKHENAESHRPPVCTRRSELFPLQALQAPSMPQCLGLGTGSTVGAVEPSCLRPLWGRPGRGGGCSLFVPCMV